MMGFDRAGGWLARISVVLLVGLSGVATAARAQEGDQAWLERLQTRSREIQQEARGSADPARLAALQEELKTVVAETLAHVSPPARVMLQLGLQVGQPVMEAGGAYMRRATDFMARAFVPERWAEPSGLAKLQRELKTLRTSNGELLAAIDGATERANAIVAASELPEGQQASLLQQFLDPLRQQIGPMRRMRELEASTYAEIDRLYTLLAEHRADWKLGGDGRGVEWSSDETRLAFEAVMGRIQAFSHEQAAQAAALREPAPAEAEPDES